MSIRINQPDSSQQPHASGAPKAPSAKEQLCKLFDTSTASLIKSYCESNKGLVAQRPIIQKNLFEAYHNPEHREVIKHVLNTENKNNNLPVALRLEFMMMICLEMFKNLDKLDDDEKETLYKFMSENYKTLNVRSKINIEQNNFFIRMTFVELKKENDINEELFETLLLDKNRHFKYSEKRNFSHYIFSKINKKEVLNEKETSFIQENYSKEVYESLQNGSLNRYECLQELSFILMMNYKNKRNITELEREFLFHYAMNSPEDVKLILRDDKPENMKQLLFSYEIAQIEFLIEMITTNILSDHCNQPTNEQKKLLQQRLMQSIKKDYSCVESSPKIKKFVLLLLSQKSTRTPNEMKILQKILPSLVKNVKITNWQKSNILTVLKKKLWKAKKKLNKSELEILIQSLSIELLEGGQIKQRQKKIHFLIDHLVEDDGKFTPLTKIINEDALENISELITQELTAKYEKNLKKHRIEKYLEETMNLQILSKKDSKERLAGWEEKRAGFKKEWLSSKTLQKAANNFMWRTLQTTAKKHSIDEHIHKKLLAIYVSPLTYYFLTENEGHVHEKNIRVCPRKQLIEDFKELPIKNVFHLFGLSVHSLKNIPLILEKALNNFSNWDKTAMEEEFVSQHVITVLEIYVKKEDNWHNKLNEQLKKQEVQQDLANELPAQFIENMKAKIERAQTETTNNPHLKQERSIKEATYEYAKEGGKKVYEGGKKIALGIVSLFGRKKEEVPVPVQKGEVAVPTQQTGSPAPTEQANSYNRDLFKQLNEAEAALKNCTNELSEHELDNIPNKVKKDVKCRLGGELYKMLEQTNSLVKRENELRRKEKEAKEKLKIPENRGEALGQLHNIYDELTEIRENRQLVEEKYNGLLKLFGTVEPPSDSLDWGTKLAGIWDSVKDFFSRTNYSYDKIVEMKRYADIGCYHTADLIAEARREFAGSQGLTQEIKNFKQWIETHPKEASEMAGDITLLASALSGEEDIGKELLLVMNAQVLTERVISGISGIREEAISEDKARYLLLCRLVSFMATGGKTAQGYFKGGVLGALFGAVKAEFIKRTTKAIDIGTKENIIIPALQLCRGYNWKQIAQVQAGFKLAAVTGEMRNALAGRNKGLMDVLKNQWLKIKFADTTGEKVLRIGVQIVLPAAATVALVGAAGTAGVATAAAFGIFALPAAPIAGLFGAATTLSIFGGFGFIFALGGLAGLDYWLFPNTHHNLLQKKLIHQGEIKLGQKKENQIAQEAQNYLKEQKRRMPRDITNDNTLKEWFALLEKQESEIKRYQEKQKIKLEKFLDENEGIKLLKSISDEDQSKTTFTTKIRLKTEKEINKIDRKVIQKELTQQELMEKAARLEEIKLTLQTYVDRQDIDEDEHKIASVEKKLQLAKDNIAKKLVLLEIQLEAEKQFKQQIRKTLIEAFIKGIKSKQWLKNVRKGKMDKVEKTIQTYISKKTPEQAKQELIHKTQTEHGIKEKDDIEYMEKALEITERELQQNPDAYLNVYGTG